MEDMQDQDGSSAKFRLLPATLGGVAGGIGGYLMGTEWPDALVGVGVGFILGGALQLLGGLWKYLAVFFALTGGFVWLLVHFLK